MRIETIRIDSFMGKTDYTLTLTPGVNILRGDNESGKSTLAEFIKFMLYGASSRASDGALSERQKYLPFGGSSFGGAMELRTAKGRFHIDRTVTETAAGFRESVSVTDLEKRAQVFKGENVGEALLGLPEAVFEKAVYISQSGEGATGGADLSAAIENLLFSGDETVSTEKAQKKLDALRVQLLHKNGKGGLLYDLASEREALAARHEKALSDNTEIIAKESSLLETEANIRKNTEDRDRLTKLCELYDNYLAHTRFAALDETEAALARTESDIAALDATFGGFSPDGEYLGKLRATAQDLSAQQNAAREAQGKATDAHRTADAATERANAKSEATVTPQEAQRMERTARTGKTLRTVGIVLFCLALAAGAAIWLLQLPPVYYAAAGGVLLLGILCFALGMRQHNKCKRALSIFGVNSVYELSDRARAWEEEAEKRERDREDAVASAAAADALLARETEQLAALKAAFTAEAKKLGGSEDLPEQLFAAIESYLERKGALAAERQALSDRAERLRAETAAYGRDAVEAILAPVGDLSVFENANIAEYRRRRDFCDNAISALAIKKSELERSLAALHATVEDPMLLFSTLAELDKKIKEAKRKYDAAELAIRAIANASDGLRSRVSPRLADYAGKLLDVMTDGKYAELGVDSSLSLTYMENGSAHPAFHLSGGTRFGAYFALRLALCDLLCKEEMPPLILDECFAHTDDKRTGQMLRILYALAGKDTQSLLFVCHDREVKLASALGVCNLIEL